MTTASDGLVGVLTQRSTRAWWSRKDGGAAGNLYVYVDVQQHPLNGGFVWNMMENSWQSTSHVDNSCVQKLMAFARFLPRGIYTPEGYCDHKVVVVMPLL